MMIQQHQTTASLFQPPLVVALLAVFKHAKEGEATINRSIDTTIFIYLGQTSWLLAHAHRKKMINLSRPRLKVSAS